MQIAIYSDGADVRDMIAARESGVQGFTTNPTLMRQCGVTDYELFAREALAAIGDLPISFEVLSDDLEEMERQARRIASWGDRVFVKIPVTNTLGASTVPVIRALCASGVKVNVTAILTTEQVRHVVGALDGALPAIISVFAGRIADSGVDPVPLMREAAAIVGTKSEARLLWASPREVLNVSHAEASGCHIITLTADLLRKLPLRGRALEKISLETVRMFYRDATAAGYEL